jgi:hypothetical protein
VAPPLGLRPLGGATEAILILIAAHSHRVCRATVWDYFSRWEWEGTIERIHHTLYVAVREQSGREASPTTAIIDSQTAKGAQKGALRSIRPVMTRARRSSAASATC